MTAIPIRYQYKIYRNNVYLGDLPSVSSPFQYSLDLDNGSVPLDIICDLPISNSSQAVSIIETENGQPLQAEDASNLETESVPIIYGASGSGQLIANDNDVFVYEYSPEYPNGKLVFSGWMTRWKINARLGQITINTISYGMDLNDYLVAGTPYTADVSQTTAPDDYKALNNAGGGFSKVGQTFVVGSGVVNIGAIDVNLWVNFPVQIGVTLKIYNSVADASAGNTPIGTAYRVLPYTGATSASALLTRFTFVTPVAVTGLNTYFMVLEIDDNSAFSGSYGVSVGIKDGNPYASGDAYYLNTYASAGTGGTGGVWLTSASAYALGDIYFVTYQSTGATNAVYTAQDPTNIFKSIIDGYHNAGGKANYSASSWTLTGLSVTYTFIVARAIEGIKKLLDFVPANYYWLVDPANQTAYFKPFSATADILLTLGMNISDVEIGVNAEGVRNILYLTGGATAGVNLFKQYTNSTSIATTGRQRIETQSDNRVTVSATADKLGAAFLAANAAEIYETTVIVPRTVIDITTILPGQTIGFSGFGNFIDNLVLGIVRMSRYSERVELSLGSLPPRTTTTLKQVQKEIEDLQTVANPSAPS